MSMELELKFLLAVADSQKLPTLLTSFGTLTENGPATLLNAYFDTPDNWFRRHDIGLRTRQKNGSFEQTIKLAGQQHGALQARPEFNLPATGIVPQLAAFPAEIWPENTDLNMLQQQLTEVFRTDFIRQSWQLTADETVIDVVFDNGEVMAGDKSEAIAELELELLNGSVNPLFTLAEYLIDQLPLRTGWLSKAARGYLLAEKQQLSQPVPDQQGLIANLKALQCTEALFYRSSTSSPEQQGFLAMPEQAAYFLLALSEELTTLQYDNYSAQAKLLASQLHQGVLVFEHAAYNRLLLALAALLLQPAVVTQGVQPS
ncbi:MULTISPECIES: inorganic triphosphatase [unclassified Arsukibacterium]|uniref:CYTH domain-containing protein n=1 Tax=unclassified Arsukibacterium TaxID=2635278 RepID=UPI000C593B3B|nr:MULTISPECIES: CYTH domain-containing protein [unclassified Arsukibacterium]MAA94692.1 adenylate cyclase [Rheinheimera sp.]MBM33757.1 adenylate cyclase [Rheinheimera sp.]HAW91472.1 CYTH domain-containing protein [Candidatus Azambacteria bacterium]